MRCSQDPAVEREARGRDTLWLFEDAPHQAAVIENRLLEQHDVQVFTDGRSVLEHLSLGAAPDVLLVGEHLPVRLAVEVCRRVRERFSPLSLPILVLLVHPTKQSIVEILEAGANDCLEAPCDDAELQARLRLLVRLRRTWMELDTNRDRLQVATEASGVGTWDLYPQTGALFWDARIKALLGVPAEAPEDYDLFLAAVHPEDRDSAHQAVQRAIDPGGKGEYRIQCRMIGIQDRIERWIASKGRAFFVDGKAVRLIGTCLDITEQKRAERSLNLLATAGAILADTTEYETRVEAAAELCVQELADLCIVDLLEGADGLRLAAVAHVDPSKESLIRALRRRYPPDPGCHPSFAVLRSGASHFAPRLDPSRIDDVAEDAGQARILGDLSIGSLLIVPLFAREHRLGAISLGRKRSRMPFDRSDLRVAEELARLAATAFDNALLLRQAERASLWMTRLQAVTSGLSGARTLEQVARAGVAQGCSAFGACSGALYRAAEGTRDLDVVQTMGYPPELEAAWQRIPMSLDLPLADAARTATPVFCETAEALAARYPHAAATLPVDVESLAAVALILDGAVLGALCFAFTRARAFSEDDRTLLTAIAHQSAQAFERARLHDAELRAREAAEAANRLRDQFLATVSHELRTPLTSILGWSRMLTSGRVPADRHQRALATIDRNACAQARLVEDLLDFSSIIVGKLELARVRVEILPAVQAAIDAIQPMADAKGVSLVPRLDPHVGAVVGDAARLQQIAWNLLSNAIKFTPRGGQATTTLRRDDSWVELVVSDTGEGIAADFLPSVFERFRQADASVTRAHGGLGLGLAIVKHLVDQHGGQIEAHSEGPGQGATFVARFPASRS